MLGEIGAFLPCGRRPRRFFALNGDAPHREKGLPGFHELARLHVRACELDAGNGRRRERVSGTKFLDGSVDVALVTKSEAFVEELSSLRDVDRGPLLRERDGSGEAAREGERQHEREPRKCLFHVSSVSWWWEGRAAFSVGERRVVGLAPRGGATAREAFRGRPRRGCV